MKTIIFDLEDILERIEDVKDVIDFFGADGLMELMPEDVIAQHLESGEKYFCVKREEANKFIDIEKSIVTDAFYDLLVDKVEEGKLNLELLVGKVVTRRLMKIAESKK